MHPEPLGRRPDTLACSAQPKALASAETQLPAEPDGRRQREHRQPQQRGQRLQWLGIAVVAMLGMLVAYLLAWR